MFVVKHNFFKERPTFFNTGFICVFDTAVFNDGFVLSPVCVVRDVPDHVFINLLRENVNLIMQNKSDVTMVD